MTAVNVAESSLNLFPFSRIKGSMYLQSAPESAKGEGHHSPTVVTICLITQLLSWEWDPWFWARPGFGNTSNFSVEKGIEPALCQPSIIMLLKKEIYYLHSLCARVRDGTGRGHGPWRPFLRLQGSSHTEHKHAHVPQQGHKSGI